MILPIIVITELTFLFYTCIPQAQRSIRESFLMAMVLACACATLLAESLSLFNAVNMLTIRVAWFIAASFLAWLTYRKRSFSSWQIPKVSLTWYEVVVLCAVVFIALLSALIAFQCPPNTADSLTYHLPRVMCWAQNGSLSYYPTPVVHQLNFPPGAEILLLHVYLLAGDDRWFNFLQWFAMIGSVIGISVLVKRLGAGTWEQLLAALVAVTVPMGVLQSNSTQTDYVLTLWVVCTVVFVWRAVYVEENMASVLWIGLSVALAFLTKGTAFIILPFLFFFFWMGRKRGFFRTTKIIGILLGLLIILNAGYWTRNMLSQQGHGIFPENDTYLLVKQFWPQGMVANIMRHSALEFMTPYDSQVKMLHDFVFTFEDKLGIAHDDKRIFSFDPINAFNGHYVFNEDVAANSLHFILGTVMIFFALFFWSKQERFYAGCVLAACILLCSVIKWQPWASRFHLPLFLLAAPLIGIGLGRVRALAWTAGLGLVIFAVFLLMTHNLRPIVGNPNIFTFKDRRMWYFAHIQDTTGYFGEVTAIVKSSGCKDVGLITNGLGYSYPLWPLISPDRSIRFHYVDVDNFSSGFGRNSVDPCLVMTEDNKEPKMLMVGDKMYMEAWENNFFQLYGKVNVQ